MKAKIEQYLQWLREGFVRMLCLHPVEAVLIVYGCVLSMIAYEKDTDDLVARLALVPLFFLAALAVNVFAGRTSWRRVYWVSWVPLIPLSLWAGLEAWLQTEPAFLTYGVLLPLVLLLCRRAVGNDRFVSDVILWLRSGVLAVFFASVAAGLFSATLFSTAYIFRLEGEWIERVWVYALILFEVFLAPSLFLMMADRWSEAELRGGRILQKLLDYIVTPALLIYTAILYLYMAKILVTWSLPRGGVAYLVFGFTLFALAVKALQFLLQKRSYDWFFDRFSLISIPTQVLFWFGVMHRTSEYGLTTPRIYLLVCGGLMTLCVLLFLSKVIGRYLYVCLVAFPIFAALAYVPYLEPDRIAVRSQEVRVERIAASLGMLSEDGKLLLEACPTDSLSRRDCHRLSESLHYLAYSDTIAFNRFGVTMAQVWQAIPASSDDDDYMAFREESDGKPDEECVRISADKSRRVDNVGRYKVLYDNLSYLYDGSEQTGYRFRDDTLHLRFGTERPALKIAAADILNSQLQRLGKGPYPEAAVLEQAQDELLNYSNDEALILFSEIQFGRCDSTIRINSISVSTILLR